MHRYLVEVPHEGDAFACARVVRAFLSTGSHYLTHADWGCRDGVHKAWMIVEAESREEARWVVPAPMRESATVVRLGRFGPQEIESILRDHGGTWDAIRAAGG
ncbi:MAG: hypothetical protein R3190_01060 [Thermoanaerobaculia bacterium]|nr:hypothetical protein [Thermoanaerobaculia bacterium]